MSSSLNNTGKALGINLGNVYVSGMAMGSLWHGYNGVNITELAT